MANAADIPAPLCFNPWKHHAGWLRQRLRDVAGADDLPALARQLIVLGTDLMDLYHGPLATVEIASGVLARLAEEGHLEADAFRAWVEAASGYGLVTLPADGSRWVLRQAPPPRYAHLHPGRNSPHTVRVRAPVLKTAVMALAHVRVFGGDPLDRATLNAVRREYLGLPPLGKGPSADHGLGAVIALLGATPI